MGTVEKRGQKLVKRSWEGMDNGKKKRGGVKTSGPDEAMPAICKSGQRCDFWS